MKKKFLVALDGSDHCWKALDLAADLARDSGSALLLVHIIPYEPMPEAYRHFAHAEGIPEEESSARYHCKRTIEDEITNKAEERARMHGITEITTKVIEGNPANEIIAVASLTGSDMIFLGSHGASGFKQIFLGGVAKKVLHHAPCACVCVR